MIYLNNNDITECTVGCGIGDYHEPNGCLCTADFHCASFVCCHNICADTC